VASSGEDISAVAEEHHPGIYTVSGLDRISPMEHHQQQQQQLTSLIEQIACTWAYCAFFQWTDNSENIPHTLGYAKMKLRELYSNGCKACGSAPLGVDNHNVKDGAITVNRVERVCECNPYWTIPDEVGGDSCICDAYSTDDEKPRELPW
jgi:hypothetical protein